MSGPISRSGPSVKYSQNWESIFGAKKSKSAAERKPAEKKAAPKKTKNK